MTRMEDLPIRSTWQRVVGTKGCPNMENLPGRSKWPRVDGRKPPREWTIPSEVYVAEVGCKEK
jgi:hypothetical protein